MFINNERDSTVFSIAYVQSGTLTLLASRGWWKPGYKLKLENHP
ncbi:hypothetical protein KIS1582_1704 [Cytobacillus firmus]|uniref:Uncharacterized protein n=1 Tax=Cytobacillus firmus TaxID=1399 RepID=A0A800MXV5_CYTFI|nr:hypothetical protein KIS1582_1704 [Cytobacillus firmus]